MVLSIAVVCLLFLYRLVRAVLIWTGIPGFSLFYLFLYLCAFEIAPSDHLEGGYSVAMQDRKQFGNYHISLAFLKVKSILVTLAKPRVREVSLLRSSEKYSLKN
ncbi:MAG: DUF4271 domain-containing protein [Bacteroidetes bacterium]|nr:DUF4271 domain-containing protein [Bacteroidota bacterium]